MKTHIRLSAMCAALISCLSPAAQTSFLETMSDEEFYLYEDSLLNALYPTVLINSIVLPPLSDSPDTPDDWNDNQPDAISSESTGHAFSIDSNCVVGEIPITSGFTPTGAKTYEIPIDVYPGMNGFQPNLSICYNSQMGDSELGRGWYISGVSSITRAGKSFLYNGTTKGIVMDGSDSFILDGIMFIKQSDNRYESEQGNIIASALQAGNTTKAFVVNFPEGYVATYGNLDSSINRLSYPLTSMKDINGNEIKYTYTFSGNQYLLTKISYNTDVSVEFTYSDRPDPFIGYSAGLKVSKEKLLSKIAVKLNTIELRAYSFDYTQQNSISLLSKLTMSARSSKFNPLTFYYGSDNSVLSYSSAKTQLTKWYEATNSSMLKVAKGKFDYNSGADGLIVLPNYNPYWQHHKPGSLFSHSQSRFDNKYSEDEKIFLYAGLNDNWADPMPDLTVGKGFIDILCADLKGDQTDYVIKINDYVDSNGSDHVAFTVYSANLYTGLGLLYTRDFTFSTVYTDGRGDKSIQPKHFYSGDFDGDGKMEILAVAVNKPFGDANLPSKCYIFDLENNRIRYQSNLLDYNVSFLGTDNSDPLDVALNSDKLVPLDYDGDGKTDLCHINATGMHIYSFDRPDGVADFSGSLVASNSSLTRNMLYCRELLPGDFNGDGLTDLLVGPAVQTLTMNWIIFNSMGNGLFDRVEFSGPANLTTASRLLLQDIDGDGVSDIIESNDTGFKTYFVRNNQLTGESMSTNFSSTNSTLIPTDINSHNTYSQLLVLKDGIITRYSCSRNLAKETLLTEMINSYGVSDRNVYSRLNDEMVSNGSFTKGYDAVFPYVNIQEPIVVLTATETQYNSTVSDSNYFTYQNAVSHRQGLGFCGFEKITVRDHHADYIVSTYEPYRYGVLKSEVSSKSDKSYTYNVSRSDKNTLSIRLTGEVDKDLLTGFTKTTSFEYDSYGYPTKETSVFSDGITSVTENTYDSMSASSTYFVGRPIGKKVTVTHDGQSYTEQSVLSSSPTLTPSQKTVYVNGNRKELHQFTYDSNGNVLTESVTPYSSGIALTTTTQYDSHGRPLKVTDPMGLTKSVSYNPIGQVASRTDCFGTTKYVYDSFDRITSVTDPQSAVTTTVLAWETEPSTVYSETVSVNNNTAPTQKKFYNGLNQLTKETEALIGNEYSIRYYGHDKYGNIASVSPPLISHQIPVFNYYTYDRFDRVTSFKNANGESTEYTYDKNKVTTVTRQLSVTREYDSQGNLVSVTDASGTIDYTVAPDGQPVSIVAPGSVETQFSYDNYRRRTALIDPSRGETTYVYDDAGNVISETDAAGNTIDMEYDNFGRLVKKSTGEFVATYSYTEKNQLASVSRDGKNSKNLTYDDFGNIKLWIEYSPDNKMFQKVYNYNSGRLTDIRYTAHQKTLAVTHLFYSNGHLNKITVDDFGTVYEISDINGFHNPTSLTTSNLTRTYSYGKDGLLTARKVSNGQNIIQHLKYSYVANSSLIASRTDAVRDIVENFAYDNLDRLTTFGSETTDYDNLGNIVSHSDLGSLNYSADLPYSVSSIVTNKMLIPSVTQGIEYTSFSRPSNISENGITAEFVYNTDYDRVMMTVKSSSATLLDRYYLGDCYERDIVNGQSVERLYLGGDFYSAPVVLVIDDEDSGQLYSILRDHLGSVTHLVDSDGNVVQELSYDAWGRMRDPETHEIYSPDELPVILFSRGFSGHEHLPWFNLINMNARLYDPFLGRFLSPDPYVQMPDFSQNFNRYSYALNNPLAFKDQNGEFLFTIFNAVFDLFTNVFSHGFNTSAYSWKHTVNAWRIDMGMFRGNFEQVVNKWTWGLINSMTGYTVAHVLNIAGKIDSVTDMDGMLALSGITVNGSAFTIGHHSFGPNDYRATWKDHLFVHEYGHYIQSQIFGPGFLSIIAKPSLFSAWFTTPHKDGDSQHIKRWFEVDASRRGANHFNKKYGPGEDGDLSTGNYFDINYFKNGWKAGMPDPSYLNPRNGRKNSKGYQTRGHLKTAWDFSFFF